MRQFAGDGLFTADTQEPNWQKAHRILMPAFGPAALKRMFAGMDDIVEQLLLKWERLGPTARMSATVNSNSSFSRSGLCTTSAKSLIVRGSLMSRLKAIELISRWCSTSQTTVSVSAALMPKRGQSVRAI